MIPPLPVTEYLPQIAAALRSAGTAVVQAEPGAGKTMLVPELVARELTDGKVILVEPRRIAARAAAAGLCAVHTWEMGRECGYVVRGEQAASRDTRILAVTPGVLLQMLRQDMELRGVGAVIFDEFHERPLESDLAFTLTLDVRAGLREDLLAVVMSATLDAARAGEFLHAPAVTVPGRTFPVEITRRTGSADVGDAPAECARAVLEMLDASEGDGLVFLPGAEEIERCFALLVPRLPETCLLRRLHGALPFAEQRQALIPAPAGRRKIILATNVAESSITVEGVRWVVDSGWEKVPVYRPGAGMTFLEPRRITLDSAIQRSGRAGRTAPGKAHRCFDAFQERAMTPHPIPELLSAELTSLALTLAHWGADAAQLRWLDAPPEAALQTARKTLLELGLTDETGRLTDAGERAAALPVHPRLAAMLLSAPPELRRTAVVLAALLEEKLPPGSDLREHLNRWEREPREFPLQRRIAARLVREFPGPDRIVPEAAGRLIAVAFPEWIGAARTRHGREFQLSGGRAAALRQDDPLLGAEFLAVARLDAGNRREAAIRLAAPLSREEIEALFAGRIREAVAVAFDPETETFSARRERKFRALTLDSVPCPVPEDGRLPALVREALRRRIELPPPEAKAARRLLERVRFGRAHGVPGLPDWSQEAFADTLPELAAGLTGVKDFADLKKAPWLELLSGQLPYAARKELDRLCPAVFTAPTGMEFSIDYSGDAPALAIPVHQLFGVRIHPVVGANAVPLKLELLSPARSPIQITSDLPGFWRGNWAIAVREMRARYPKHEWPDDPAKAAPMRRSVKRATPCR